MILIYKMGSMYSKIKTVLCGCCQNGFSFKSSCCSKEDMMNIELEVEPNQSQPLPDTELQLNCFGLGIKRNSHTSHQKND